MAKNELPRPSGHIKLCCNKNFVLNPPCYTNTLLLSYILCLCGVLLFCTIIGIPIGISLIIIGIILYITFVILIFVQMSESCTNISLLIEFLKENLCLPLLPCIFPLYVIDCPYVYYDEFDISAKYTYSTCWNDEKYNSKYCGGKFYRRGILCAYDKRYAIMTHSPTDCQRNDSMSKNDRNLYRNLMSYLLFPVTIHIAVFGCILCIIGLIILIFASPFILIGFIIYYIFIGCVWCFNKLQEQSTKCECSNNYCNCFDWCFIVDSQTEQNEIK